jgi:hypothetical protein
MASGSAALQEARRQFAFEAADLLTQRGSDEAELQRGLSHAAMFDDAGEIA